MTRDISKSTRVGAVVILSLSLANWGCADSRFPPTRALAPDPAASSGAVAWTLADVFGESWNARADSVVCVSAKDEHGQYAPGLYEVDARTGHAAMIASVFDIGTPIRLGWNPTHSNLVLCDYGLGAAVLDVSNGSLRPLFDDNRYIFFPTWSPGGDSIWYGRGRSNSEPLSFGGLHIQGLYGGASRRFVCNDGSGVFGSRISFSPDGRWIAWADAILVDGRNYGQNEIAVVDRLTGERRRLTSLRGDAENPFWIEGGRLIAFDFVDSTAFAYPTTPRHTYVVSRMGGGASQWFTDLGASETQDGYPAGPAPLGSRLAATMPGGRDGAAILWIMDGLGRRRRPLFPTWPDTAGTPGSAQTGWRAP